MRSLGAKLKAVAFDKSKTKTNIPEKEIKASILQEMILYLTRLTQNTSLANEIISSLGKE